MRHHNANRKFGRKSGQRAALLKSLANSLIRDEKITTTEAKAKELRPFVEKLITHGISGTPASHRLIASRLGNVTLAKKMIDIVGPKYKSRKGGYTRIMRLPRRISDGSPMAVIELI